MITKREVDKLRDEYMKKLAEELVRVQPINLPPDILKRLLPDNHEDSTSN